MELHIDPAWLLHMAEKEDSGIVSVGGFFTSEVSEVEAQTPQAFCNLTHKDGRVVPVPREQLEAYILEHKGDLQQEPSRLPLEGAELF